MVRSHPRKRHVGRSHRIAAKLLALVAITVACDTSEVRTLHPNQASAGPQSDSAGLGSQGDVVHPVARFRPSEGLSPVRVSLLATDRGKRTLVKPNTEIGVLEGDPDYMFGEITDVKIGSTGNIIVLDSKYSDLRMYSPAGVLLAKGGKPGSGPGEFREPLSAAIDDRGASVYAGDLDLTVDRFVRHGQRLSYDTAFKVGVEPKDLCVISDHLYVHGTSLQMDGLIQIFDNDGHRKGVFGKLYKSGVPLIDFKANIGLIACSPGLNLIAYAPGGLVGEVRAFRGDGTPVWRTELADFKPVTLISKSGGRGSRVIIPEHGFHRVESLEFMAPDFLVLQVAFVTRTSLRGKTPFESIRTLVLNARDGSFAESWDLDERIGAIRLRSVVTASSDPFPQIRVRRF